MASVRPPQPQQPYRFCICAVRQVYDFTTALLFSIETQQTIGFGSRRTNPHCPEAILVMMCQSCFGVIIQVKRFEENNETCIKLLSSTCRAVSSCYVCGCIVCGSSTGFTSSVRCNAVVWCIMDSHTQRPTFKRKNTAPFRKYFCVAVHRGIIIL
jgi:Inward rectifier potassium channel transmembrane domain